MVVLESESTSLDSTVTSSSLAFKPWKNDMTWLHPYNQAVTCPFAPLHKLSTPLHVMLPSDPTLLHYLYNRPRPLGKGRLLH